MNALSVFSFQNSHPVRVVMVDGDPWFVAKDVCDALTLVNSRKALMSLDDDEKGVTLSDTPGGKQKFNLISEAGLYTLILRCRDAVKQGTTAWRFRKWVTGEVLPAIRKSGSYAYVEPAPKRAGEPLHWRHKNELQQLVNDVARTFRYNNAWVTGIWVALRRACNNPSPNLITTDDLPAILFELRRITSVAQHATSVMGNYEREILRLVVRNGYEIGAVEGLPPATMMVEASPQLPAYLERAFQHLESLETLLPEQRPAIEK